MVKFSGKLILFLAIAGLCIGYLILRDGKAPQVSLSSESGPVSAGKPLVITADDSGTGLESLSVSISQEGKTTILLDKTFNKGVSHYSQDLSLKQLSLKDGPLFVDVTASDRARWTNNAKKRFSLQFDSGPPVISVLTTAHNLTQGGAGLVVFRISENVKRAGVQVADHFFPAFLQKGNIYACLFAFPYNVTPRDFIPRIVADDLAGNEGSAGIYYHAKPRAGRFDRINISESFLTEKKPEFQHYFPETSDPLQLYLRANRELRANNLSTLKQLSAKTADHPLWKDAFLRLPRSASRSDFADQRDYYFNGSKVDHQVHLGLDLASLAASPVPAANSGTVIYASELGIYGRCVIIDHGLGLQSLYSHLSSIGVKVGDKVEKGQIIGRTGSTGMAGGDHLHFGIIVGGIEVNPREWLDQHWINDNFVNKWKQVSGAS